MHIPKWLIATAGLLLVVLIASVAFFIGRETSQPPEAPIADSALGRSHPPSETRRQSRRLQLLKQAAAR